MLERSWAATAVASRYADGFVAAFAQALSAASQRAGRLILVALDAARSDAEIAAVATQLMHQREIMAELEMGNVWLADDVEDWIREHRPDVAEDPEA